MRPRTARLILSAVLAVAVCRADAAEADIPVVHFDISRFDIAGNTILTPAEVNAAVAPYVGKGRDFGDVQRALEALEAAYHARGYKLVTVRLPEQELGDGVVRLNVVQATIGEVKVSGNHVVDEANVRRALPALQPGASPNLDQVSASLAMANDNPARNIRLTLQNGAGDDQIDALLEVRDEKPWRIMLNLDNSGNSATGKTHAGVLLQHANLWGRDHVGSFQYTTSVEEPGKVSVYGLGYHIPLYAQGDSVDLYASYSDTDSGLVSAGVFNLAVSGRGTVVGARYTQALARHGELDSRLVYGAELKAYRNDVLFAGENFGNDVTVHPLSLGWVGNRAAAGGEASLALTLVQNVAGGERGSADDFARNRVGARPWYTLLRLSAGFNRRLGTDWQGRLLLSGQFTRDALVPGEQFGAGGASSVRGLEERALSTDTGLSANAELYTPELCPAGGRWQCRALVFIDAARGHRNHALPGELVSTSVASTGLGLRVALGKDLSLQADYGHVVHAGAVGGGRNKAHVRLSIAY